MAALCSRIAREVAAVGFDPLPAKTCGSPVDTVVVHSTLGPWLYISASSLTLGWYDGEGLGLALSPGVRVALLLRSSGEGPFLCRRLEMEVFTPREHLASAVSAPSVGYVDAISDIDTDVTRISVTFLTVTGLFIVKGF